MSIRFGNDRICGGDNIGDLFVRGIVSSVTNNFISWGGTDGKTLKDSGFNSSSFVSTSELANRTPYMSGYDDLSDPFYKYGISLTWDSGTRKLTVSHSSGTVTFYSYNVRYSYANGNSKLECTVPDGSYSYTYYFNNLGQLIANQDYNVSAEYNYSCVVARLVYDATVGVKNEILCIKETHGASEPNGLSQRLHNTTGSVWSSGHDLIGINADDTSFGITTGVVYDEDVKITMDGQPDSGSAIFPKYYFDGKYALNGPIIKRGSVSSLCYLQASEIGLVGTRPVYNFYNTGTGLWEPRAMTSTSDYICMHMFVANSGFNNIGVTFVVGQALYTTISSARNGILVETGLIVSSSVAAREAVNIYSFIIDGLGRIKAVDGSGSLYIDNRRTNSSTAGSSQIIVPTISDVLAAGGTTVSSTEFEYLGNVTSDIQSQIGSKESTANKGTNGGYCELDANGLIPITRAPASLLGGVRYQGTWNATTNTPTIITPTDSATKGYYYKVGTGGTWDSIDWAVGDWIISNGTTWDKIDNTDAVTSVAGRTGAVTLAKGDVGLSNVDNLQQEPIITKSTGYAKWTGSAWSFANETYCLTGDSRLSDARTPVSHTHGNITNAGAIGVLANLPLITTTSGVITVGSFGTGSNTFCQGNDSRLSDSRVASDVYSWAKVQTITTLPGAGSSSTYGSLEISGSKNDFAGIHFSHTGDTFMSGTPTSLNSGMYNTSTGWRWLFDKRGNLDIQGNGLAAKFDNDTVKLRALCFSNTSCVVGYTNFAGIMTNAYFGSNGRYKRVVDTKFPVLLDVNNEDATLEFYTSTAGTADSNIDFTRKLLVDKSGNITLGDSVPVSGNFSTVANYSVNVSNMVNGSLVLGSVSGSQPIPAIITKQTAAGAQAMYYLSLASDTNSAPDVQFDTRENDNTDFSSITNVAFKFSRYNSNMLFQLYRNGNAEHYGYTRLGSNAPSIKMKKLTGTTSNTNNGTVSVAHGLTASKILSVDVVVNYGSVYSNSRRRVASGYDFDVEISASNIDVINYNAFNLLSKGFTILLTYEE